MKNNKTRVVVVEFDSQGGLIHYAYQFCSALAERGFEVTLITGTDYELKSMPHNFKVYPFFNLWSRYEPTSIRVKEQLTVNRVDIRYKRLSRRIVRAAILAREWFRLSRHLAESKPEIVQLGIIKYFFETFFLFYLRKKIPNLTQINHECERREDGDRRLSAVLDQMQAMAYRLFDVIFVHAVSSRQLLIRRFGCKAERVITIPHGDEGIFNSLDGQKRKEVELKQRYGLVDSDLIVLFFGLVSPSKGLPDLIEAFAIVRQAIPAKLVVAGYPTKNMDVELIQRKVRKHNIEQHVVFDLRYIPMDCVGALMTLSTVVVFPYHSCSQSGSLQVAYSFGRPVVATAVGGLAEVVDDGRSGFLVPPHRPDALAGKIVKLLKEKKRSEEMGLYARELSQAQHGWGAITKKVATIYKGL